MKTLASDSFIFLTCKFYIKKIISFLRKSVTYVGELDPVEITEKNVRP